MVPRPLSSLRVNTLRLHDHFVHDTHSLASEDEVSHAMVARGVESHLFSLVRGAVQALYLLASAVFYGV